MHRPLTLRRLRSDERGFSLLEILVASFLLVILLAVISPLIKTFQFSFLRDRTRNQVQLDTMNSLDTITHFMKEGRSNTVLISGSPQYPWSSMTFDVLNPTLTVVRYTFAQNNSTITMSFGPIPPPPAVPPPPTVSTLAQNVKFLSFSLPRADDPSVVAVEICLQVNTDGSHIENMTRSNIVKMLPPVTPN